MPAPNQLQRSMQQGQVQATLTDTSVSPDGTSIVQTYTVNFTQSQLTMQLAQAQNQLASMTNQIANLNATIATIQGQLAMFPVVATPIQPVI